ncbi:MAG: stage V sporulation protein AC [Oscillospiraceae bacterium]|nr:stage V sporulation protein AC [Oscillospiraceae bacterium]
MIMSVSKDEYGKMADKASPPSPVLKNCCFAFLVGGFICLLGQIIFDLCKMRDIEESTGRSIVSMSLVLLTAILTGLGVFDNIAKFAGAGTMVPITGFANSIVSPAMEFKSEGEILGTAANMFKIAGPVIVYGCSSAVLYGLIIYIFKLY